MPEYFTHTHRVSYADCTIGNHVYYSRYLDFLEVARGEFFRHIGVPFLSLQEQGIIFPVVEVSLRYKAAARYDDVLRTEIRMSEVGRVRLKFRYTIHNQFRHLLIEAETVHACTGVDDKLKRVPDTVAAQLKRFEVVTSATAE